MMKIVVRYVEKTTPIFGDPCIFKGRLKRLSLYDGNPRQTFTMLRRAYLAAPASGCEHPAATSRIVAQIGSASFSIDGRETIIACIASLLVERRIVYVSCRVRVSINEACISFLRRPR